MFHPTDTKFYNDIIFIKGNQKGAKKDQVKGQQHMIVKTWESYQPIESKTSASPIIKEKQEDPVFAIKTLRLYDSNNDIITEILTEQIEGDFPPSFFYDTSTLFYDDKLYYFKRHQVEQLGPCSATGKVIK